MAESIVYPPQTIEMNWDYIAFTFKGKHSYKDFGIVRVSDGDRYTQNLTPNLSDKTAEADGSDGMYFLGTQHRQKEFQISFAFDRLTEAKLRGLKQWLGSKEPGDLWFAEEPYKVYTAKVTGTPSIKYIPFDDYDEQGNIIRVYKGEGNVTFTAYWPYAHTPDLVFSNVFSVPGATYVSFSLEAQKLKGGCLWIIDENKGAVHGNVEIRYQGKRISGCDNSGPEGPGYFQLLNLEESELRLFDELIVYLYGIDDKQLRIYCGTEDGLDYNQPILLESADGKNDYAYIGFSGRNDFLLASGITTHTDGANPGDLPAPFVLSRSGITDPNTIFTITDKVYIKTLTTVYDLKWDSKTGIVSGLSPVPAEESIRIPVPVEGNAVGGIPVGGCQPKLNGATLTYHYWYY